MSEQVSLWEVRLSDLDEYLLSLNTIQRRWVYLEPIFGRGALPREEARFKRVDEDFRYCVGSINTIQYYMAILSFMCAILSLHVYQVYNVRHSERQQSCFSELKGWD